MGLVRVALRPAPIPTTFVWHHSSQLAFTCAVLTMRKLRCIIVQHVGDKCGCWLAVLDVVYWIAITSDILSKHEM